MYKPLQVIRKADELEDILVCLYSQISSHDITWFYFNSCLFCTAFCNGQNDELPSPGDVYSSQSTEAGSGASAHNVQLFSEAADTGHGETLSGGDLC